MHNITENVSLITENVTENVSIFTANVTENVKEYVELTEENSEQRKENSEPSIFITENLNIFDFYEIDYGPAKLQCFTSIAQV